MRRSDSPGLCRVPTTAVVGFRSRRQPRNRARSGRVEDVLAVLSPGQGSQKPGFLTPWLELPGAEARLRWWSALAGVDLVHLGTAADADEIKDTARTQPLLVAAALLAAEQLPMYDVGLVAGHSVGELGAAALAGVLPAEAAITLAGVRGREMAAACALEPTGMSAVLGGDPDEVLAAIEAHGLLPGQPQRRRPDRRGRRARRAGQVRRPSRRPGPGSSRCRWPARSTRRTWRRPSRRWRHRRRASPSPTRPASCCPTWTAPPSTTAARCCSAWSARSPRRCAGTCACGRCADLGVTGVIELPPGRHPGRAGQARAQGRRRPEIVTLNTPGRPARRPRPDRPARHGPQPRADPAVPGRGGRQRRHVRARPRAWPRATRSAPARSSARS